MLNSNIQARIEDHKNSFQQLDLDELRKRREDFAVDLRRQKRSQHNLKRRAVNSGCTQLFDNDGEEVIMIQNITPDLIQASPNLGSSSYTDTQKLLILKDLLVSSSSPALILSTLKVLRETLATETGAPIGIYINIGLAPILMKYLDLTHSSEIVEQASWTVCNLCSGAHEYVDSMVNIGVIPGLVKIIHPDVPNCIEHSLWGLANLAGDCQEYRNQILKEGIIELIKELMKNNSGGVVIIRAISWLLCNICRGVTNYNIEIAEQIVLILKKITGLTADPECVIECLWGISYVGSGDDTHIECILRANLLQFVFKYLESNTPESILIPALRSAGSVATGTHEQTQLLINHGILDKLLILIESPFNLVRKEVYWILSNISVGTYRQINSLISHPIIYKSMKGLLETDQNIYREVGWFFSNLGKKCEYNQILTLDDKNILEYLKEGYRIQDTEFIRHMLELTISLLAAGRQDSECKGIEVNSMAVRFRETGCLDLLENLQNLPNEEIHIMVIRILDEFWGTDEVFAEQILDTPENGFDFS